MAAAEPEEQWERMKTILQETTAEVVGLSTRKHQGWFDETDMETPELFEMKAPATIVCLQYVMIKPLRLHTRVPAVHSRPSLGPCRMIGRLQFLSRHNAMLTWATCAPSMRH